MMTPEDSNIIVTRLIWTVNTKSILSSINNRRSCNASRDFLICKSLTRRCINTWITVGTTLGGGKGDRVNYVPDAYTYVCTSLRNKFDTSIKKWSIVLPGIRSPGKLNTFFLNPDDELPRLDEYSRGVTMRPTRGSLPFRIYLERCRNADFIFWNVSREFLEIIPENTKIILPGTEHLSGPLKNRKK